MDRLGHLRAEGLFDLPFSNRANPVPPPMKIIGRFRIFLGTKVPSGACMRRMLRSFIWLNTQSVALPPST